MQLKTEQLSEQEMQRYNRQMMMNGWGLDGRLTFIQAPETPCYQCLFPEAAPKSVFPVLGATPGVIGTLEAMETLKYLAGVGTNLKNRLLVWDGAAMDFKFYKTHHDPDCPVRASAQHD